jgi:acetyl esterase/lipase
VKPATFGDSTGALLAATLIVERRQREKGQGPAFALLERSPVLAVNHSTAW